MYRTLITAAALGLLALPAAAQQSENRNKVGTLNCAVGPSIGLIVTSQREMNCTFRPANGRSETYRGTVRRFGLDIGVTGRGQMVWAVYAISDAPTRGALAGSYAGVSGEVSVGAGVGANLLVGGSRNTFTLQPLSVQAQTGLNLALGVSNFELRSTSRQNTSAQ